MMIVAAYVWWRFGGWAELPLVTKVESVVRLTNMDLLLMPDSPFGTFSTGFLYFLYE